MGFSFTPASPASLFAFLTIVVAILAAFAFGIYRSYRAVEIERQEKVAAKRTRVTMFWIVVWLAAFCGAVETGYARENPMPGIPMLFLLVVITSVAFAFSPIGTRLSRGVAVSYLVLFQVFRIPLELVLHEWATQGVIPLTMTWTGQNFDIFAGVVALIAFPFARRSRVVARLANVIGFASLLNVMRVALFSSPVPMGWNIEPKLQLITHAPYALIGPVCVGGALIGHVLLARALLRRPDEAA